MRIISGKAKGTKLYTLQGQNTRPTLDRVKESIFNIIQNKIKGAVFLDLFSGSGAIGLEAVSRGAKKAILCDTSKDAVDIIKKNAEKTHLEERVEIYNLDFKNCLKKITDQDIDLIYLDPPYKTDFIQQSINLMLELNLLNTDSLIIAETDDGKVLEGIDNQNIEITDIRKYGRALVAFMKVK